ncbi:hypothetical protein CKQ80_09670 [Pseudomonas moraviensis]|uniref:Uncharacterized protein n=1 Tax=Pseudomonas moraviensis TaxID=321662 RepID=A0A2A2PJK8_9PSED|nr:hypothetical protein [Pseudomonas moraviensis]PAW51053.1 hypothetical protein CKQ68_27505 [Pseudomonas moraviensis]PAW55563.1 hypothetical protein CKQ80_09670 [Pseudomonas moraviensis]
MTALITQDSATGALFTCGLLLIAFAGGTYLLFDWAQSGILFCIGMAVCLVTCVISALLGEKASRGDIATMVVGSAFFMWLIIRNM